MQDEQTRQPQNDAPTDADTGVGSSPPTESLHPPLTKKERHIGERLIELGIFSIATLSIVIIFLIFFFVFKEASPVFFGPSTHADTAAMAATTSGAGTDTSLESEQYNPDATSSGDTSLESEQYNPSGTTETAADTSLESEQYNPETRGSDSTGSATAPSISQPPPHELTAAEKEAEARRIVGYDYPILTHDSPVKPSYLLFDTWQPNSEHPRYGIYPIIVGTLKTTLVALLIAAPLGILAALYSAFFAPKWIRETLKPAIELLAGFPSVVIGFFCLMTVGSFVQWLFGVETRLNAVVGGIGLALAVIPIIYTISDDALRAVPGSLREAALALGASEWQVAYKVMLPAATPGIFAAILLGIGRAFGETMIALLATGNAVTFDWNFFQGVRTFAATIGAEMGEVVGGSPHYQVLFVLGVILFVFSFTINFITEFFVKQRLIKRFRGSE